MIEMKPCTRPRHAKLYAMVHARNANDHMWRWRPGKVKGVTFKDAPTLYDAVHCDPCRGTGKIDDVTCTACRGVGFDRHHILDHEGDLVYVVEELDFGDVDGPA